MNKKKTIKHKAIDSWLETEIRKLCKIHYSLMRSEAAKRVIASKKSKFNEPS